ncbi:hypothetical protein [Confluentibacter citreus]|uniref:hypothetical protein n=1 Tax=Confluentibacter citreus TaxID=2007307 RepID=UPI000C28FC1E|nr:hypothetical protein [Confluentibacter citreus]
MKKIILLLLLIVASLQGFSQTPGISYQAVILNPNEKELPGANAQTSILANRIVVVRFTIINDSNNSEYQEYHQTKTDAYGMINLLIGHGTRIGSSYFGDIVWGGFSKKLKVDIDFSGTGSNFTPLSEQELTFMPQPALGQDAQAILDNSASILAEITRATNAESVIQADVNTNEAASILADIALQASIDNVQADIDASEASITSAIAAVQTDVDNNEAASILADTILQANIDNLQLDVDANQAAASVAIATIQSDVDANEIAAQTALNLKADLNSPTFTGTVSGIDKGMVGLGNVDNTSDVNKPVSTATQTVLDLKVDKVLGKALSTEDYTTAEKTKLEAITGTNTGDQEISGIATNTANIGDLTNLTTIDKSSLVDAINEIEIGKADLESPTFTGTPLAPTATDGTNTTQIATTEFVNNAVNTATPVTEVVDEFLATASQTSFTLTQTPSLNSKVKMYVNGIRISNAAYSVIGTTLTYIPVSNGGYVLTTGDRIQMDFYH